MHDRAIQGIRKCESTKRAERYKEPEYCRTYPGKNKVRIYLPILEWTDADIERFIRERGIKCAPVYYDENGGFDVAQRLGCICCPMKSKKKLIEDYKRYPRFLRAEIVALAKHMKEKPYGTAASRFGTPWNQMFYHIFCESMEEYNSYIGGGLFIDNQVDTKRFLEDYFKIDLSF